MTDDLTNNSPDIAPVGKGLDNIALDDTIAKAMADQGGWDDDQIDVSSGRGFSSQWFSGGSTEAADEREEEGATLAHDTSLPRSRTLPDASSASRDEWYARHGFGDDHHEAWKKAGIEPEAAVSHLAMIDRAYNRDPAGTEAWLRAQRGIQLNQEEMQAAQRTAALLQQDNLTRQIDHYTRNIVEPVSKMMPAKVWSQIEPYIVENIQRLQTTYPEMNSRPKELLMKAVHMARRQVGIGSEASPKSGTRQAQPSQAQKERAAADRAARRALAGITGQININR